MRSEGKKRTLELSLIQGFSKIEKLFGGAKKALQPDNPINAHNENIDKIFFFMVFQN